MSLLETFLTASQGATILFLAMLILLAKAINPSGLAFGQLRCIREKCGISRHFTRQFEFRYLCLGSGQQEVTR